MVVVIVTHPAPTLADHELRALLESTVPTYRDVPGLRRKYFIGNGETAGGVYEWEDRAAADRWFDEAWHERMRERLGVEPRVEYFAAPGCVDNVRGESFIET